MEKNKKVFEWADDLPESQKNISIVVCLVLAAVFCVSAQGVLRVASLEDLRKIGRFDAYPLSADYELVCDIDASDSRVRPFEPIGGGRPFTGRFSGRGGVVYVIRDLRVSRPNAGHVGLFGVVGYGAEVSGVGVEADTIAGHYAVGVLAGSNNGRIVNCYGSGVVVAGRGESNAGGLVGVNGGEIYRSYSDARVYGVENVGGLVGLLRIAEDGAGEVQRCFALGAVSGVSNAGGLVGQVFGGRVRESFSAGPVAGLGATGGLIGRDFATTSGWSDRGTVDVEWDTKYVGAAEVIGSFWDIEASGWRASAGGEGRSGVQMRSRGTFAGWDFGRVWAIEEGVGYPQLVGVPRYTGTLAYTVDKEECGRLRVLFGTGGVAELYDYSAAVVPGAEGPEVWAKAWAGCRFVEWSDGLKTPSRVDTALRDTAKYTAKFERIGGVAARVYKYRVGWGGALRVSGVSGFASAVDTVVVGGGRVVAAAMADSGYRFAGWNDGVAGVVRTDSVGRDFMATANFRVSGGGVIKVSRYDDLYLIGEYEGYPLNGNYELVCDIDLSSSGRLKPIGALGAPFTGVFWGNGYVISGLDIGRGGTPGDYIGLFGYAYGADIRNVFVEGSVAGVDNVGMLVGECVNTVVDGCGARGAVRGRSGVGGLVGRSVGSLVARSYSTASVDGSGAEVGGLVGGARGSFLAQSYAGGAVSAVGDVGGAVGFGAGGQAQDCYAVGGVVGDGAVGGFIGVAGGGIGVSRSYSVGFVLGGAVGSGGFAGTLGGESLGYAGGAVSIAGCYWDVERSGKGKGASAGGVGMATAAMLLKGTYTGWDFDGVWEIGGYPRLRGLAPDTTPEFFFERRRVSAISSVSAKPLVRVVGRVLYVNALPGESVMIRLIDMRGKTVARYDVVGAKRLLMSMAASGGYIVEARRRGGRVSESSVRIFR